MTGITPWFLAILELALAMTLAIWCLSRPAVFSVYYPALNHGTETQDAVAVVNWLSSTHRQRSLSHALQSGQMQPKELRHYGEVRRLLAQLPGMAGVLAASLLILLMVARPSRALWITAQKRGIVLWLSLLAIAGGLALWDWQLFWAWVHQPFFGPKAWRLSSDAYSLQLFPVAFWRTLTAVVLVAPAIFLGLAWLGARLGGKQDALPPSSSHSPMAR